MKIIIFIFILMLTLSLSKKKKDIKRIVERASSEVSSKERLKHPAKGQSISNKTISHGDAYFNFQGTVRRNFAIELTFQHSGSNAVCSPVSALLPLGKLILGAEGKTRQELCTAIGVGKKSALKKSFTDLIKKLQYIPGVKLDVASRIYVAPEAQIVDKFSESAKEIFQSDLTKLSFKDPQQAVDEINGWVSRQTSGMIPLLLEPSHISPRASMVLVNAVYFKGKWKNPFRHLYIGEFYAPTGQKKVQLMNNQNRYRYTKSEILNAEIIEIPYEGSGSNFIIVLPLEKTGLPLLLNQLKLAPKLLKNALEQLKSATVDLTIPKFSITTRFDLKDLYEKIGLKKIASRHSGLKKIVKNQELQVSAAIQKAVIEVHETGTEASAASAIVFATGVRPPNMINFTADHPFLFYVEAHSEQLFAGVYMDI